MGVLRSLFGGGHQGDELISGWRSTAERGVFIRSESGLVLLGHTADRGDHPYGVEVVGESNYQDALWRAIGSRSAVSNRRHFVQAALKREPDNRYDHNAIAVHAHTGRGFERVGYLPRDKAQEYRADFVELERLGYSTGVCDACIVGGFEDERRELASLGIWLNLGWPGRIIPPEDER